MQAVVVDDVETLVCCFGEVEHQAEVGVVIAQYDLLYKAMLSTNQEGKALTGSLPLCTSSLVRDPLLDRDGNPIAYAKPLMMLIDEFSTSTADSVPGMIADARRGQLYGMRTNGAGGNNTSFHAGAYTEGITGMLRP